MTSFPSLIAERDRIEAELCKAQTALDVFPRSAIGLHPDSVRALPEYQTAARLVQSLFQKLRAVNTVLARQYRNELREQSRARRTPR